MVKKLNNESGVIYDPPSGWKYGFPKPYLPLKDETLDQTLLRDGYPQNEIDQGMSKYTRFIAPEAELRKLFPSLKRA